MSEIKNKSALVTGGSRGLGRGTVEALAAEDANTWAIDPNTRIGSAVHISPVATPENNDRLAVLD